jgi:hypothetical protein
MSTCIVAIHRAAACRLTDCIVYTRIVATWHVTSCQIANTILAA